MSPGAESLQIKENPLATSGTVDTVGDISLRSGAFDAVGDRNPVPGRAGCPRPEQRAPGRAECPRLQGAGGRMASAEGVLHRPEVMARAVLVGGRRRRQQVEQPPVTRITGPRNRLGPGSVGRTGTHLSPQS